jgi:hypothetical protein
MGLAIINDSGVSVSAYNKSLFHTLGLVSIVLLLIPFFALLHEFPAFRSMESLPCAFGLRFVPHLINLDDQLKELY